MKNSSEPSSNGKDEPTRHVIFDVSPTPADFKQWLNRRCMGGNWFVCFDDYLWVMEPDEAWLLQIVINLGGRKPKNKTSLALWKDGWILCTVKYLLKRSKGRFRPNGQVRILKALQNLGIIEVKAQGSPPRRYVRVDLIRLEKMIDEASKRGETSIVEKSPRLSAEKPPRSYGRKDKATKGSKEPLEKTHCPPAPRGDEVSPSRGFFPEAVCRFDRDCAEQLYKALAAKNKTRYASSPTSWVPTFRKLREDLKDDRDRIRRVLDWYVANIGVEFVPRAYSAGSFAERFFNIEDMIQGSDSDRKKRREREEKERQEENMTW